MTNKIIFLISCFGLAAGFTFWDPAEDHPFLNTYFSNENITQAFAQLQINYPDQVKVFSLGTTPNDRRINEITITNNVSDWQTAYKPHVKYVGNMHGDEVRGRGLLLKLAYYLVGMSAQEDVVQLLDSTVFHLVPTINPDGFAVATKGCIGTSGRYTSGGKDMNRDFPTHWFQGTTQSMEKETELVIKYADAVPAVLSINFHDGALVANYPWDSDPDLPTGVYSASPDDDLFVHMAETYSTNHAYMSKGKNQCAYDDFEDGITNGNEWYQVFHGMQDWNYYFKDCFELTVELGCCKYPYDAEATYTDVWTDNFRSILAYTQLAQHGIRGSVVDHNGMPLLGSTISVSGEGKPVKVRHKSGYYWRPLLSGLYNITASKPGYMNFTRRNVRVEENDSTEVSFILISKSQVRNRKQEK